MGGCYNFLLLVTVGMSALWDLGIGTQQHSLSLARNLEIGTIPRLYEIDSAAFYGHAPYDNYRTPVLNRIYRASLQSWLYSGAIEILQSAASPAWSKDAWSFLPLDMDNIRASVSALNMPMLNSSGYPANLTFHTPALRARLQCHSLDYASNTSRWLERIDFTNETAGNDTNRPPGLSYGYVLKGFAGRGSDVGHFQCCANETNGVPGNAAIGYWSDLDYSSTKFTSSMTVLWIVGQPLNGTFESTDGSVDPDHNYGPLWIWSEEPRMSAVNCTPIYEQADTCVTVELDTGMVQNYSILTEPEPVTSAWSDSYLPRNTSIDYKGGNFFVVQGAFNVSSLRNVTARYSSRSFRHCREY